MVQRGIISYGPGGPISFPGLGELTEKLTIMTGLIDNNGVINEFYKLIEPDLRNNQNGRRCITGCILVILNYYFDRRKYAGGQIFSQFFCGADKIPQI